MKQVGVDFDRPGHTYYPAIPTKGVAVGSPIMAIDLKSLKKLEALPASAFAEAPGEEDRFVVSVRLRDGADHPSYIVPRARLGPKIMTGEITARDLMRIDSDPDVVSVALSRPLPLIEPK